MDYAHTRDVKQLNAGMSAAEKERRDTQGRAPRAVLVWCCPKCAAQPLQMV